MGPVLVVYPQICQTLSDESLISATLPRILLAAPEGEVQRIGVALPNVPRSSPLPACRRSSSQGKACVILARSRFLPGKRQSGDRRGKRVGGITMDWKERIAVDPHICHGRPCIRGTRIMVSVVLDNLAAGIPPGEIIASYPALQRADIQAALEYAAELARGRVVPLTSQAA